ncbi:uncharacterized protein V1518DRAFT_284120 [Limtongia smithiae]|uniref:uncharacterized protein n=1 Tax=Limtongia smithiae TaxID=1125753 RepID=UPI0034CD0B8A
MTSAVKNYIHKVAIVGATGNSGSYMVEALLATGKHTVTAISRMESTATVPDGVKVAKVDYADSATLVAALTGQDALVMTMNVMAPSDSEAKLITAAADAGVKWILPNDWSPDIADEVLSKEIFIGEAKRANRELIAKLGKSAYVAVECGFWYEWSLAMGAGYGFDLAGRKVTMYDDGETKICTSTLPQVGRAVANILSLKVAPDGPDDTTPCLEMLRNKFVYVSSFTVSQRDILASAMRVSGTSLADWDITYEPSTTRYARSVAEIQSGSRAGFVKQLYTRVFFQDGKGNVEKTKGLHNKILGLPTDEDIDVFTKIAFERQLTLDKIGMNLPA